ncbi:MAG: 4Fe-4S binding protein [Bacteroidales bacterium]|nr:4Fe-4S binding protein [Bacteroidales bacterium]
MKRDIIKIDEELCDGCGLCIPNCHEGALQIIDEKACLVSDLMCDGLGACIGHCPQGAITIEQREAEPYDEIAVIKEMVKKGSNVVIAHLQHLKEHNEMEFLQQGVQYLEQNRNSLEFNPDNVKYYVHNNIKPENLTKKEENMVEKNTCSAGCPGSMPVDFNINIEQMNKAALLKTEQQTSKSASELRHWPVQMHLINPATSYFKNSDLLLAADCVAFSMGDFHQNYLKGKTLIIACPKLDSGIETYIAKITSLIGDAKINTITVMMMEVPCCSGLLQIVKTATSQAKRKVPVKAMIIGIKGEVISEEWI